jgi:hypothetical protein
MNNPLLFGYLCVGTEENLKESEGYLSLLA